MKTLLFFSFLSLAVFFTACDNGQKDESSTDETTSEVEETTAPKISATYTVDAEKSTFKWIGKKTTGEHWGYVKLKEGTINVQDGEITGGSIVADMTTISVNDIEGEDAANLQGHLKNEDFFYVDSFPEATFTLTDVMANEDGLKINGDLTIKDQTHPVSFNAEIDVDKKRLTVKGNMVFDRTQYGIKYKSKSILGDAADKFIYDEVTVELGLVAKATN